MKVGDVYNGVVTRIEHYGLVVEADGRPGLLRIVDLTSGYISHPSDIAAVGDVVRFQVLQLNDPARRPGEQFNGSMRTLEPKSPNTKNWLI